jgi:hypothetical protein
MKTFTIIFYSDAGHGWGKVKRQVLRNLNLIDKISTYSYQYKDNVYLEEDCDLSVLCQALNERGTKIKFVEKNCATYSKIRSYEHFSMQEDDAIIPANRQEQSVCMA